MPYPEPCEHLSVSEELFRSGLSYLPATIDSAMAELNTAFQAASAEMYAQSGAQGGAQAGPDMNAGQANPGQNNGKQDDNVQDADFEEVK